MCVWERWIVHLTGPGRALLTYWIDEEISVMLEVFE